MRWGLALAALATATAASPAAAPVGPAVPRRIVSLNLCSDQLVLALADRAQIAGITRNATDPHMSAEAARARGLPVVSNSAEQLLAIDPDLVIGMPLNQSAVRTLANPRLRTLDIPWADTLGQTFAAVRRTAAAVGHPDRGERLIESMRAELARLPKSGRGRVAAYYQRRGFLTGTGTLVDELMRRVGLVNLAGRLGKPPLAQLSIEELVAAQPDLLIVESDRVVDQGTEMLHHPALRSIPRIHIPAAWTVCAGPASVRAARSMAAQLAAVR